MSCSSWREGEAHDPPGGWSVGWRHRRYREILREKGPLCCSLCGGWSGLWDLSTFSIELRITFITICQNLDMMGGVPSHPPPFPPFLLPRCWTPGFGSLVFDLLEAMDCRKLHG